MIANLITLADFKGIVPFSTNISSDLATPHIADAQEIDVWPLLPEALRLALAEPVAQWSATLTSLFSDHLKRLLVLESARRMLLWHGLHITPNGAENTAGQPITDQQRTQLRADLQAKASFYRPSALATVHVLYPATTPGCGTSAARRPGRGGLTMSAV